MICIYQKKITNILIIAALFVSFFFSVSTPALASSLIDQTTNHGTGNGFSCDAPAGDGGIILLALGTDQGANPPDTPSGWTALETDLGQPSIFFGSDGSVLYTYWRDGDGVTGTISGTTFGGGIFGWVANCARIDTSDVGDPIDTSVTDQSDVAGTSPYSIPFSGLTTTSSDTLVFVITQIDTLTADSITGFTNPLGFTNELNSEDTYANLNWSSREYNSAGATGPLDSQATLSATPGGYAMFSVAIKINGNSAPVLNTITDSPDPVVVGNDVTFSIDWTDNDDDGVKTYICKTDSFTTGSGCDDDSWADQSSNYSTTTPAVLSFTTTSDDLGTNDYYVFMTDPDGAEASSTVHTFTVNNPAGITVTESSSTTEVTEGGATDTYSIVLNSPPTDGF